MKMLSLGLLSIMALSTQVQAKTACFKVSEETIGKMILTRSVAKVDWDIKSDSRNTKEHGDFIWDFSETEFQTQGSSFLMNRTGDGSDIKITIKKTSVSYQGLFSNGEPIGKATIYPVVKCP